MADITCSRCSNTREGFERPPFPGAIGARIVGEICKECWAAGLSSKHMLTQPLRADVMDPQARTFLTRNMDAFLFKSGQADDVDTSKQGTISH